MPRIPRIHDFSSRVDPSADHKSDTSAYDVQDNSGFLEKKQKVLRRVHRAIIIILINSNSLTSTQREVRCVQLRIYVNSIVTRSVEWMLPNRSRAQFDTIESAGRLRFSNGDPSHCGRIRARDIFSEFSHRNRIDLLKCEWADIGTNWKAVGNGIAWLAETDGNG